MTALESAFFRRLMRTSVNVLPLSQLIEPLQEALPAVERHGPDVAVSGLCSDSRAVVKGDLFIAGIGTRDDGLAHVEEALAKGAVAVLAARRPVGINGTACITVGDVPLAKALVANAFFGHPSRRLDTIGVTGTNGKTTTTFMLRSILTMDGRGTGLVGTLGAWIGGRHEPLRHTTPDAIELQRLLARMVDENLSAAVMEVSSHALMQRRAHGIAFDAAIFTNLTPDHLDYHGTMEAYAAAKGRLFEELSESAVAVLNADDPASRLYRLSTPARVLTFGLSTQAGVRVDNPEGYSSVTSPRVRVAYEFADSGFTVAGAWGKAFKLPSLYALGHPLVGNPDLVPERGESAEIELSQTLLDGAARWSATYFEGEFRNAIDFDSGPPPMLVNRNRVDTSGFELAGQLDVGEQWKLDASVTNAKSEIASTGGELRNRPEWRAGLGAHWAPSTTLKFSATATYVGESFDSSIATGDVDLPAYTRVDASAVWQISPQFQTYLAVDNLTDQQYEQFVGFEVRGIMPRLGVKLSF